MKHFISLLLIISFVATAIFGFAIFDMSPNHSSGGCVASAINGTACPTSIMDMALYHISALQTLTIAVVPSISHWLLLLVSLLLISVSIFLFYKNLLLPRLEFSPQRLRGLALNSSYSRRKIISWLSLFELSPTL